ncbi:unnamed protein product [Prunus armeniaca]|uniref:Uncharacterized protein n=1 Tax=Prunus armeniaca TaxID=36596 RepID=A0A6J5WZQ6_PRUAR|nr:unnamed protein product [Prunus armeniaca]
MNTKLCRRTRQNPSIQITKLPSPAIPSSQLVPTICSTKCLKEALLQQLGTNMPLSRDVNLPDMPFVTETKTQEDLPVPTLCKSETVSGLASAKPGQSFVWFLPTIIESVSPAINLDIIYIFSIRAIRIAFFTTNNFSKWNFLHLKQYSKRLSSSGGIYSSGVSAQDCVSKGDNVFDNLVATENKMANYPDDGVISDNMTSSDVFEDQKVEMRQNLTELEGSVQAARDDGFAKFKQQGTMVLYYH